MIDLHVRHEGHVADILFAHPPVNYFTEQLLEMLADAMDSAAADGARVILLRSGGRHFCAGADFAAIGGSVGERAEAARAMYTVGLRLFHQPLPIVAAVQGAAVGGGLGLACAADFRVVAADTRLHANFSRLGFHPGFGLSATLPLLVGHQKAADLLYTSRPVDGRESVSIGLADRLAEGDLVRGAMQFAQDIARSAPLATQSIKATHRAEIRTRVELALERELAEQSRLWATKDAEIGIRAAAERTEPIFIGA